VGQRVASLRRQFKKTISMNRRLVA
jgi:hypothetical protein